MSAQAQTQNLNIWKISFKALKFLLIFLVIGFVLDILNIPLFDGFIAGTIYGAFAIAEFIIVDLGIAMLQGLFDSIANGV